MQVQEKYIILGNGFDIECGLKTSYSHFLDFIKTVQKNSYYIPQRDPDEYLKPFISKHTTWLPSFEISKWYKMPNNYWYQHFKNAGIPKNWIDFENEISKVVSIAKEETRKNYSIDDNLNNTSHIFGYTLNNLTEKMNNRTYRSIEAKLLEELMEFSSAFDLYLQYFAENGGIEITDAISNLIDRTTDAKCYVLSFNYTTTFQRIAKKIKLTNPIEYCYIHGQVGQDGLGKLVFGIEENQEEMDNVDILYAPFTKCFQRINKNTDSQYADWLSRIKNYETDRELYIFGHSLGASDKTVLNDFIMSPHMKTIVFSHNRYDPESKQSRNKKATIGRIRYEFPEAMIAKGNYEKYFDLETGKPLNPLRDTEPEEEKAQRNQQKSKSPKAQIATKQNIQTRFQPDRTPSHSSRTEEEDDEEKKKEEELEANMEKALREIRENAEMFKRKDREKQLRGEEEERRKELFADMAIAESIEADNARNDLDDLLQHIAADEPEQTKNEEEGQEEKEANPNNTNKADSMKETDDREDREDENDRDDEEELQQAYDTYLASQERIAVLYHIICGIQKTLQVHARKKPDEIMNAYKAQTINHILEEVRSRYEGTEYLDLLALIEEPREEEKNGRILLTGMTYSDAEVLLEHYTNILRFIKNAATHPD